MQSLCVCLFRQKMWASKFVGALVCNTQFLSCLLHRLWHLLYNQVCRRLLVFSWKSRNLWFCRQIQVMESVAVYIPYHFFVYVVSQLNETGAIQIMILHTWGCSRVLFINVYKHFIYSFYLLKIHGKYIRVRKQGVCWVIVSPNGFYPHCLVCEASLFMLVFVWFF